MRHTLFLLAFVCLLTGVAHAASGLAAAPQPSPDITFEAQLLEDGWIRITPDVYARPHDDGSVETLAFGTAGLELTLEELRPQLTLLEAEFERTGEPDLLDGMAGLRRRIEATERELALLEGSGSGVGAREGLSTTEPIEPGCTTTITRFADARPGGDGPEAEARASFSDTCNAYGDVYAYAHAHGDLGTVYTTKTQTDNPPATYGSSSAGAFADVVADRSCYSYAYAEVRVRDDLGNWTTWTQSDSNTLCRDLTVNIEMISPSLDTDSSHVVTLPCNTCKYVDWQAATNLPVSSYAWRWDSSPVGSSRTYRRRICPFQVGSHELRVTADDGVQTAVDSVTVGVYELCFEDPDPCEATLQELPCKIE